MQQHHQEEPTRTQSRGKLARSPLNSAASSSEEEEDSGSATAASPSGGRSSSSSSSNSVCHERQPQPASKSAQEWEWLPQPPPPLPLPLQPPPSVGPQALATAPPDMLSVSGSSASSSDAAGSGNSSGGSSSFGATAGPSLRDDHPADDALGPAGPQAKSPAATASMGVHFRTTQEMLFGQPQGLFKGYPVMQRGRGSWKPLR